MLDDPENRLSIEVIFPAHPGDFCQPPEGHLEFAVCGLDLVMTLTSSHIFGDCGTRGFGDLSRTTVRN